MELPWLKNKKKNQQGAVITDQKQYRKPDDGSVSMLKDQVASELFGAIEKKDFKAIRSSLQALVQMIREQDIEQDNQDG